MRPTFFFFFYTLLLSLFPFPGCALYFPSFVCLLYFSSPACSSLCPSLWKSYKPVTKATFSRNPFLICLILFSSKHRSGPKAPLLVYVIMVCLPYHEAPGVRSCLSCSQLHPQLLEQSLRYCRGSKNLSQLTQSWGCHVSKASERFHPGVGCLPSHLVVIGHG